VHTNLPQTEFIIIPRKEISRKINVNKVNTKHVDQNQIISVSVMP